MSITGRLARFASSRSNDSRAKAEGSGYLGTPTQSQASDVSNFQEQGEEPLMGVSRTVQIVLYIALT